MYIHWDKKYETGQPLIDAEHRLLVMLFRKLDVAIKTQLSDKTLTRIILEVRKFVEFHFVSEENLMHESNYPDTTAHRAVHTELLMKLNSMTAQLASHREYPDDLLSFLNDWLIDHIARHDQEIAEYVRKSENRPVAELIYKEYLQ